MTTRTNGGGGVVSRGYASVISAKGKKGKEKREGVTRAEKRLQSGRRIVLFLEGELSVNGSSKGGRGGGGGEGKEIKI